MKADALRCNYCNGFVDQKTYKCPYCGTQYVKPREEPFIRPIELKMVAVDAPVDVIGVNREIDMYDYKVMQDCGVPVEQEIRRDMAKQIADAIAEKLEIYEDNDIVRRRKIYCARIRLVKPEFRF